MGASTTLVLNGRRVPASVGTTLLDAALAGRIVIPHDCSTGQCGTCRVRVYDGLVDAQDTASRDTVLACRARVVGEAVIEFDEVPEEVTRTGTVTGMEDLTPDIVQVVVSLTDRLTFLPGQYVKTTFKGFPARDYSPTLRLDGSAELNELVFHVRREPRGVVSEALGRAVAPGHPVKVRGPFGAAYYRAGPGRLVLVSTGVGFAPVWIVARACRLREPEREMHVVAGARAAANLYMRQATDWLAERGAAVTLTCSGEGGGTTVRQGRPTLHLPRLLPTDTVIVCGAPGMVAAVELLAAAGGATCHADPFLPARTPPSLRERLLRPFLTRRYGSAGAADHA